MATTYLEACNEVLADLNEIPLTSTNFTSAVSIQRHVKNIVNKAYMDLNNPEFMWPWLAVAEPQGAFMGNTYVSTVAGTTWYLLNPMSSGINDDYGHVDWNSFQLTTVGVPGATAPFVVKNLSFLDYREWKDKESIKQIRDSADTQVYTIPSYVVNSPDGRRFGLAGIPNGVYRVYFTAYNRPSKLVDYNDTLEIPDQYVTVLVSRARYYAWQRKENPNQAAIALQEYEQGLDGMVEQTINQAPDRFISTMAGF